MFINLNVIVTCFWLAGISAVGDRAFEVVETKRCWASSSDLGAFFNHLLVCLHDNLIFVNVLPKGVRAIAH
ncbi:hypothetical protein [Microcoleus sp.]|uniref:hypothetical protein n=1 Tax=Microcoleus sp. TaxID=44472 RepID=UPI003523E651